ncbi:GNAT family N-acetyltransferase [Streptomyces bacillaris]|uniref:GNAT family N-acetyltransferase n=1 Tax=Streptomyces bacillaris TaxID=68179 RepID=UPI003460D2CC
MFAVSLGDDKAELRPLEIWQAEEFLAHMDRARELVDPWIPFASFATDLDSARDLLRRYAEKQAADTGRLYGIWLEPAAQGRGLITRAAERLIDWAVYERGMHRVEWDASAANTRSIAVAKRLGMTRDGVIRQNYLYRGVRHDSEIWSVLAPEWRARTGR